MTPLILQHPGLSRPALQSWRTTTAVRIFALAWATGTAVSGSTLVRSAPILVVLLLLAAFTSTLEWMTRDRPRHWYAVCEAMAATTLLVATQSGADLGAYLAVPVINAGVRHGLVTTLNVTLVSALAMTATIAAASTMYSLEMVGVTVPWLSIGLGVGLLASWQSRSIRSLAARQAPYVAAHQLMARVHQLASSGSLGLDTAGLAADLDRAMRHATGCARSTVFVVEPGDTLRALNGGQDVERLAAEIAIAESGRTPGAAVIPLRGATQTLGYCVLVGVPRWTPELDERAHNVADDFAVRLGTAVLFEDVRVLATSEERNRIAREMHDGVAQEIVGLGYIVDEIEAISNDASTREVAHTLRAEITRIVSEIRFSIFDLRQETTNGRLAASLADCARGVRRATGLQVHLSLAESGPPLPTRTAAEVLRVAQEAIGNVRKHACAANLWVTLDSDGSALSLKIEDDGVGNVEPRAHHWGLQTMRERAERVGAQLDISPRTDGGTIISLLSVTPPSLPRKAIYEHHGAID